MTEYTISPAAAVLIAFTLALLYTVEGFPRRLSGLLLLVLLLSPGPRGRSFGRALFEEIAYLIDPPRPVPLGEGSRVPEMTP